MKVKVIKPYRDLQLKRTLIVNYEFDVTNERAEVLINKGVVKPIEIETTNEVVEESQEQVEVMEDVDTKTRKICSKSSKRNESKKGV